MPDGSAFEFTQKANAVPTTVGGVTKDAKSSGEVAPTINTASENSIPTSDGNVNAKFSLKAYSDVEKRSAPYRPSSRRAVEVVRFTITVYPLLTGMST